MSIGSILGAAMKGAAFGYVGQKIGEKTIDAFAGLAADSALRAAFSAVNLALNKGAGQNYVSASKSVRVEPFTLIDSRLMRFPYLKDVLTNSQKFFTSFYLMAVAAENKIGSVKVGKHLDKFAPDRNLQQASLNFLAVESYQFGLPYVGEESGFARYAAYCAEAALPLPIPSHSFEANDNVRVANEVSNLMMGQVVNVTMIDGDKSHVVPITIRLRTIGMDPIVMTEVLSLGGEDRSRSARLRKWRMGEISGFRDLVLEIDRIDRYRQAAMRDRSGYFRKVHSRSTRNFMTHLLSGEPSIGEASSIAIVSRETVRDVENNISGRLDDFSIRQQIFDDSMLILLVVVDQDHETVTVYVRDIEEGQMYALKDLKSGSSSPDMTELLRALMEGKIPGRL